MDCSGVESSGNDPMDLCGNGESAAPEPPASANMQDSRYLAQLEQYLQLVARHRAEEGQLSESNRALELKTREELAQFAAVRQEAPRLQPRPFIFTYQGGDSGNDIGDRHISTKTAPPENSIMEQCDVEPKRSPTDPERSPSRPATVPQTPTRPAAKPAQHTGIAPIIIDLGSDPEDEGSAARERETSPAGYDRGNQPATKPRTTTQIRSGGSRSGRGPQARPNAGADEHRQKPTSLRRPTAQGAWWSATEEQWEAMTRPERQRRSSTGKFMETSRGKDAAVPCRRCGDLKTACRVLSEAEIQKYDGYGGRCVRCMFDRRACSLAASTRNPAPDRPLPARAESSERPLDTARARDARRSSTAVVNSRSSGAKGLVRTTYIDLSDDD